MAKTFKRDVARKLRNSGYSLNEIRDKLNEPKSTVRYWCRDIILSVKQLKRLSQKQNLGGTISAEKLRKKRIETIQNLKKTGINEIGNITKRELFLIGVALYWAEGYNKGDGEFGFTNSSPRIIKLMIRWLNSACGVPNKQIHLRISINRYHKKRIKSILKYWSEITNIPLPQFSKPTFIKIKNKKIYLNSEDHFGTLRIKVRNSTNFRRKIMGWIEGVYKNIN